MLCYIPTVSSFLLILSLSSSVSTSFKPSDKPILIIPGIMGSQLWARLNRTSVNHPQCLKTSDWYNIWLSLEQLVYPVEECASDNMMLQFNPNTSKFSPVDGVNITAPQFGNTSTIEFLDPDLHSLEPAATFYAMVQYFVDNYGYTRGGTLRGAPYDWRYAAVGLESNGYYAKLKDLIEEMYTSYNNPVTIIVHSMGGPVSLYFLTQVVSQDWKDTYIKQYITLSAVWAGSVKSNQAIISGDNEGIILDRPIWGRASQRTFQTTLWLLPPAGDVWGPNNTIVYAPTGEYSAYDYEKLMADVGYTNGPAMYRLIKDKTSEFPAPNVTTYCFYGLGKETPYKLHYDPDNFPNSPPKVTTIDGDGTVPNISLTVCGRWSKQQVHPVTLRSFSPVEHVHMVKNKDVIDAVSKIIIADD